MVRGHRRRPGAALRRGPGGTLGRAGPALGRGGERSLSGDQAARRLVDLQVLVGIGGLCLAERNPAMAVLALAGYVAVRGFQRMGPRSPLPLKGWVSNTLALAAVGLLLVEARQPGTELVVAMGHFTVLLQGLLLAGRRTARDDALLLVLGLVQDARGVGALVDGARRRRDDGVVRGRGRGPRAAVDAADTRAGARAQHGGGGAPSASLAELPPRPPRPRCPPSPRSAASSWAGSWWRRWSPPRSSSPPRGRESGARSDNVATLGGLRGTGFAARVELGGETPRRVLDGPVYHVTIRQGGGNIGRDGARLPAPRRGAGPVRARVPQLGPQRRGRAGGRPGEAEPRRERGGELRTPGHPGAGGREGRTRFRPPRPARPGHALGHARAPAGRAAGRAARADGADDVRGHAGVGADGGPPVAGLQPDRPAVAGDRPEGSGDGGLPPDDRAAPRRRARRRVPATPPATPAGPDRAGPWWRTPELGRLVPARAGARGAGGAGRAHARGPARPAPGSTLLGGPAPVGSGSWRTTSSPRRGSAATPPRAPSPKTANGSSGSSTSCGRTTPTRWTTRRCPRGRTR